MKVDDDDVQVPAVKQGEETDDEGRKVTCLMKMDNIIRIGPVFPAYRIVVFDEAANTYERFVPEDVIEVRCMGEDIRLVLMRKGIPSEKEEEPKKQKTDEGCAWCTRSRDACICGVGPEEGE